ncbi:ABC transporter permease [Marinivivus vitaminiproducens]|uniref:ABC transporter permease n=1 Tax=Marinivivus vitaminiproducens TaxID=3035935 RepID=UPI0027A9BE60|nr:proline/glycine betaine ABC transporter permease [Geminicoccaceae bacterium SCSIO 64248]
MDFFTLPIEDWVEAAVDFALDHFQPALNVVETIVLIVTGAVGAVLSVLPPPLLLIVIVLLSLWRCGLGFGIFTLVALLLTAGMGVWPQMVDTLGLVLGSAILSLILGVPLGIWMARSAKARAVLKTILDFMQTMPAFVYLIPAVIFFGLGKVPGTLATVIFAMPPAVRLTALGIQQVPSEIVEAGKAFGCTSRQLLFKVQLPNALPSIMAGVNQTIMLALSMVVIASMIGAGGLGNVVLSGIQRLDVGLGFKGGLAVVFLAIILDRITQSFGEGARRPAAGQLGGLRRFLPAPAASSSPSQP